ncbi:MAG: 4Fe-4S dicluster domain-containing protein [Chloroflexi bacterium]|nr:4Fe-4S dicluster domain-containing protein [Chloroflexota bacterium]
MTTSSRTGSAGIVIDAERCKGCRLCVAVCPRGIIDMAAHLNQGGYNPAVVLEVRAGECTGCLACALMCPDAAVAVYRRRRATPA